MSESLSGKGPTKLVCSATHAFNFRRHITKNFVLKLLRDRKCFIYLTVSVLSNAASEKFLIPKLNKKTQKIQDDQGGFLLNPSI